MTSRIKNTEVHCRLQGPFLGAQGGEKTHNRRFTDEKEKDSEE